MHFSSFFKNKRLKSSTKVAQHATFSYACAHLCATTLYNKVAEIDHFAFIAQLCFTIIR